MKISHKELSICQQGPKNWVTSRIALDEDGSGPRFSYSRALFYSICELHKTDFKTARKQLERYLAKFANEKKKEEMRGLLAEYAVWLNKSGIVVMDSNVTIKYPSGGDWHLGGVISRIDLLPDGYKAVLFEPIVPDWKQQLRMPLIQLAVAERYGRPAKEIRVGLQDLDGNATADYKYGEASRQKAGTIFEELGKTVLKLFPPPKK